MVIALDYSTQLQRLRRKVGESPFIAEALKSIDGFVSLPRSDRASPVEEIFPDIKQMPAKGAVEEEQAYQAMKLALNF